MLRLEPSPRLRLHVQDDHAVVIDVLEQPRGLDQGIDGRGLEGWRLGGGGNRRDQGGGQETGERDAGPSPQGIAPTTHGRPARRAVRTGPGHGNPAKTAQNRDVTVTRKLREAPGFPFLDVHIFRLQQIRDLGLHVDVHDLEVQPQVDQRHVAPLVERVR